MTFWITLAGIIGLCIQAGILLHLQTTFFSPRTNRFLAMISGMILYLAVSLTGSIFSAAKDTIFSTASSDKAC